MNEIKRETKHLTVSHSIRNIFPRVVVVVVVGFTGSIHIAFGVRTQRESLRTLDADDVQVLRARVIGAVHHGAGRDTEGHLVLGTGGVTATYS